MNLTYKNRKQSSEKMKKNYPEFLVPLPIVLRLNMLPVRPVSTKDSDILGGI